MRRQHQSFIILPLISSNLSKSNTNYSDKQVPNLLPEFITGFFDGGDTDGTFSISLTFNKNKDKLISLNLMSGIVGLHTL
jgi:hypothetical protein